MSLPRLVDPAPAISTTGDSPLTRRQPDACTQVGPAQGRAGTRARPSTAGSAGGVAGNRDGLLARRGPGEPGLHRVPQAPAADQQPERERRQRRDAGRVERVGQVDAGQRPGRDARRRSCRWSPRRRRCPAPSSCARPARPAPPAGTAPATPAANAVPSTMPSAAMNHTSGTTGYSRPQMPTPAIPTTSAKKPPSRSMNLPNHGDSTRIGAANVKKVTPIRPTLAPSWLEVQAPDHLVGAAGEEAADVERDGGDQQAVQEPRRPGRRRPPCSSLGRRPRSRLRATRARFGHARRARAAPRARSSARRPRTRRSAGP